MEILESLTKVARASAGHWDLWQVLAGDCGYLAVCVVRRRLH